MSIRVDNRDRGGMTLVELVTTTAIMSVLAVACGSAVVLASRAMEISAEPIETSSPSDAADRVAADVQTALIFYECTDTAATFTVPDRDGDGMPETLRYAWAGEEGDPLTLACNGGNPVTVATDVNVFGLSYLRQTVAPTAPQPQESEEMVLISHDDAPGGSLSTFWLKSKYLAAQYFEPTLPANVLSWKITRVVLRLEECGPAHVDVQIRPADASQKPTNQVLEQVSLLDADLPSSYEWVYINFSSLGDLDPAAGLCIVAAGPYTQSSGAIEYEENGSPMTPNTHWMESWDTGGSWSGPSDKKDMRFYIYGTVTTLGEPQWP